MKHQSIRWLLLVAICIFTLAACSASIPTPLVNNSIVILDGTSFGQSFTAVNNGLSGISVMLGPAVSPSSGELKFHLRDSPQATADIASAVLPISEINRQAYYKFDFPAQNSSAHKDYFLQVQVTGGQARIFTSPGNSYLDGAMYENLTPQDVQLAFTLSYDRLGYIWGVISNLAGWLPVILIGMILFILPGWGLFSLLWRGWEAENWAVRLGLAGGMSLAIYPLFILWTNLVGLHLGVFYAIIPPLAGFLAIVWKSRKYIIQLPQNLRNRSIFSHLHFTPSLDTLLGDVAFVIILGLIIASRFWIIRSLDVPLFGDSYQHAMISQLIINHGGLFNSWQPYADLVTFTYHFGFHSDVAVYHWVSGFSAEQSTLWAGQLINILAILGLYPLAYKITKNKWAGSVAMLVAGLLSSMPNYYVNWGRYTQLAGQAVLPVVIWVAWSIFDRPHPDGYTSFFQRIVSWRTLGIDLGSLVITWFGLAGLALTHYRILILAVLFFPVFGIFSLRGKKFVDWLGKTAWMGIGGIALFLPWFVHVFGGKIMAMFMTGITTLPSSVAQSAQVINNIKDLAIYLPTLIWLLLIGGVLLGFLFLHRDMIIFTIWWLLIILATNPDWIGLPGSGVITNFAIQITFYIPAGVAVGFAISWIIQKLQRIDRLVWQGGQPRILPATVTFIASAMIISLGIWGLPQRLRDLNISSYALITRPDLRAMAWIRENIPTDADFLVNSFLAFGDSVVAGSDGGWWIPLLADRKTSLPPLTSGFEMSEGMAAPSTANTLVKEIQDKGIENPEVIARLLSEGISYIYVGQRQGTINYNGPQVLNPWEMEQNSIFKVVYHQDRVWIFEIAH